MRALSKLSLSVVTLAALAACGGGGGGGAPTTTTSGTAPGSGTASTASAAMFFSQGTTSTTYNLNDCVYSGADSTGANLSNTAGGTATMTITGDGDISLSFTGTGGGTGAGNVPALSDSWTAANRSAASISINRTTARLTNTYYDFSAERTRLSLVNSIRATYTPGAVTTTRNSDNRVRYTDAIGGNRNFECGYASNPVFSPNFTDYNARISRVTTDVTAINSPSATQTLVARVATWDNSNIGSTTPAWARLNLSTGQLASSSTQAGTYIDFDIATPLSSGNVAATYKESVSGSVMSFQVNIHDPSINYFEFTINPTTQLNPVPKF